MNVKNIKEAYYYYSSILSQLVRIFTVLMIIALAIMPLQFNKITFVICVAILYVDLFQYLIGVIVHKYNLNKISKTTKKNDNDFFKYSKKINRYINTSFYIKIILFFVGVDMFLMSLYNYI